MSENSDMIDVIIGIVKLQRKYTIVCCYSVAITGIAIIEAVKIWG